MQIAVELREFENEKHDCRITENWVDKLHLVAEKEGDQYYLAALNRLFQLIKRDQEEELYQEVSKVLKDLAQRCKIDHQELEEPGKHIVLEEYELNEENEKDSV